jgi:predicted PurR-regulated permease PerM
LTGLADLRKGQSSTMQKVQTAASEIDKVTTQIRATDSTNNKQATHVVVEPPALKLGNFLLAGSMGAAGLIGQAAMVLFLAYFLLLSGDTYKRKLVRLLGPLMSSRKITVHILDDNDINASIQSYISNSR